MHLEPQDASEAALAATIKFIKAEGVPGDAARLLRQIGEASSNGASKEALLRMARPAALELDGGISSNLPQPTVHRGAGAVSVASMVNREQRRVERLMRAAYGVGHTQRRFMALPRCEQEAQVRARVGEALESREIRLGRLTPR